MTDYYNLIISFFIGAIGSGSYPLLVYLGFAGGKMEKERKQILKPFFEDPLLISPLYCLFGGFISTVLQWLTIDILVPLQSLIAGITWPIFVSGFLSGRQSELSSEEKKQISGKDLLGKMKNDEEFKSQVEEFKSQVEALSKKDIKKEDLINKKE